VIGSLRGVLLDRTGRSGHTAEVLVEVGGVGYRLVMPASLAGQLGPLGSAVFVHVHTHVREDALVLFGFQTRDERLCFEALIGAHGVGPAVALALLSVHSPAALQRAVHNDDADALMLVPGIGRKTATRLLVELESRLGEAFFDSELHMMSSADDEAGDPGSPASAETGAGGGAGGAGSGGAGGAGVAARPSQAQMRAEVRAEVRTALAGLGYGADEIRHVLARLPADGRLEDQLRHALRELAAAR
jgi:Holliday junction DNA helicase RuvA